MFLFFFPCYPFHYFIWAFCPSDENIWSEFDLSILLLKVPSSPTTHFYLLSLFFHYLNMNSVFFIFFHFFQKLPSLTSLYCSRWLSYNPSKSTSSLTLEMLCPIWYPLAICGYLHLITIKYYL